MKLFGRKKKTMTQEEKNDTEQRIIEVLKTVFDPEASSIVHRTWTGDSFHI